MKPGTLLGRRRFLSLCGSGLLGMGCGVMDPPTLTVTSPGRLAARPGTPSIPAPSGLTQLGIGSGRDGLLYVPTTYRPEQPLPLVVGLHGTGGGAAAWGGWDGLAEDRGFIFLAVDSRGAAWSLGSSEDLDFLNRALAFTFERCAIDETNIGLVGYSSGASYALSVGIVNGDLFTHLAGFALGFFAPPASPVGKPLVFLAHGASDPVAPVSSSRVLAQELTSQGYDVTYVEFQGDHTIPMAVALQQVDWFLDV